MDYRSINGDRSAFQQRVLSDIKTELNVQGIQVDVLNIKTVETPGSTYAEDLAAGELALARQNAAVATAKADQESKFAQIQAQEAVAARSRDYSLKASGFKAEQDKAAAAAEAAGQIAKAQQDALIAARDREALAARALVEQERLDIEQKKPADAAAYAAAKKAEGEMQAAQHAADAALYTQQKQAEASLFTKQKDAEARAFAMVKSVTGVDVASTLADKLGRPSTAPTEPAVSGDRVRPQTSDAVES